MTREMQRGNQGLRTVELGDGQVVRLERTAAFERARRLVDDGEPLDDVVAAISETARTNAAREGFVKDGEPGGDPTAGGSTVVSTEPTPPSGPSSAAHRLGGRVRSAMKERLGKD
jgi:hypothetical protein